MESLLVGGRHRLQKEEIIDLQGFSRLVRKSVRIVSHHATPSAFNFCTNIISWYMRRIQIKEEQMLYMMVVG